MGYKGATRHGPESKDGMVVFGFGRNRQKMPLMKKPNTIYFGFFDEQVMSHNDHKKINSYIKNLID